jgi:hypothetical protein
MLTGAGFMLTSIQFMLTSLRFTLTGAGQVKQKFGPRFHRRSCPCHHLET